MTPLPAGSPSASDLISSPTQSEQNTKTVIRMIRRLFARNIGSFISAAVLLLFGGSALAQTLVPGWNQLSPAMAPSARYFTGVTYDAGHSQVVLFGGITTGGTFVNDTWIWNGTWTNVTPSSGNPPARSGFGMTYDAAHGQVVLFGGRSSASGTLGDTWLWNGTTWTQASPAHSPGPRNNMSMVYDAAQGNVVLFGGDVTANSGLASNDTWTWNGSDWIQQSPAAVTPTRDTYSMAYDAAHGQVVVFGGTDEFGNNLNDTWVWDGSNWIQKSPSTVPSVRFGQGMAYDAALGQVVMFGGIGASGDLNDTWTWDGTNWTLVSSSANPSLREAPSGMAYDPAQGQILLFGGFSSTNAPLGDTWEFSPTQNFGNINVCSGGATTPAPCRVTLSLTYNVSTATTLGTPQVVTQGATGLDFSLANGGTCANFSGPGTCTVNVTFAPIASGLRMGAVELFDNSSQPNLLVSTPIYGVGQAPEIAFGLGTQTTVGSGLGLQQPQGVAVDAAGSVYISDYLLRKVFKVTGGVSSTIPASGLAGPFGVAVDGAGDVFIADTPNQRVVKVPYLGNGNYGPQTTVGSVTIPYGVAVDGAGNVYIVDSEIDAVVKVTPSGVQSTVAVLGTTSNPYYVAVDAAGDLFVSEPSSSTPQVVKVTPSGAQTTIPISGLPCPYGVAVDAAGDVYVSDPCNAEVVEVAPGGVQTTVTSSGLTSPITVAVDQAGNLFLGSENAVPVVEVNRSQGPTLNFGTVAVNGRSNDIGVTIQNVGNQTLTGSVGSASNANFANDLINSTCTSINGISLTPAGTCALAIYAQPTSTGALGGAVTVSDNSFNGAPATQTIQLLVTGQGVIPPDTVTLTLVGSGNGTITDNLANINCSLTAGATSGSCAANYQANTQVTLTATPAAGTAFAGWGAPCSGSSSLTCTFAVTAPLNIGAIFNQQNLGTANVCPPGQNSQQCSKTLGLTFSIPTTTTLGAIQVVTQGATGLDFALGNGSTCTGMITGGNSCTANVTFTPLAPGLRMGAVTLLDSTGNPVVSTLIYGTGIAPAVAFGPATPTVVNTGSPSLATPNGAAVDAAGNLYIAVAGNGQIGGGAEVLKVAPNGTVTTVGSNLAYPQGLAVDGAGDLFIADNNQNEVIEVTPAGVQTAMSFGITAQLGVAVDGAGDVFVSDFNASEVVEAPAGCTTSACTTVVYSAPAGLHPIGLAVDAAGDLFITDFADSPAFLPGKVVKIPAGCTSANCQTTVGTGWSQPEAIAVDAAGDVFVADELPKVVEVPAGCSSSSCQITLGGMLAFGIAVDAKGDVIVPDRDVNVATDPDSNQVVVFPGSQPPSLSFAITNVSSTSSDSPKPVYVQNVGNSTLAGTLAVSTLAPNFLASGPCNSFSLSPGAICSESFSFAPQSLGQFTGTAFFSDNTLNLSSAVVLQPVNMVGIGGVGGLATTTAVPNVVGLTQPAAGSALSGAGLATGSVTSAPSNIVPSGSVIASNPSAGTQVSLNSSVKLLVSTGPSQPPAPNPLSLMNNYFVTGDIASAGVTLRGAPVAANGTVTGTVNIPVSSGPGSPGVPTGADLIDGLFYWTTLEKNSTPPSGYSATFLGYPITGQQIGKDLPYTDPVTAQSGTLRVYRADVNTWFQNGTGATAGIRIGSGAFTFSLPGPGTANPNILLDEGGSLAIIYRVLSPNFPLKAVLIYDGSAIPASSTTQNMVGIYDAIIGGNASAEVTALYVDFNGWNNSSGSVALSQPDQYNASLNAGAAYSAVFLSTRVNSPDGDGMLGAWKAGPPAADFHGGQPGYYDVKTGAWVGLPGAKVGQKDLFVQLDYMCGAVLTSGPNAGSCDPNKENLFPSPDVSGNDPLAMVTQAFASMNPPIALHLQVGNAVPEDTCTDSPGQLCQFPGQSGVVGWKNSLEFSKVWPRNFASCAAGGDCSPRFPYGQKDSYHYVLFGHSLAIPAWNTRYGTLTSINAVAGGTTTIVTTDRGTGINACPSRITISGIQGMPSLNGVYNTTSCPNTSTMIISTPAGVSSWSYPNATLAEPVIGITSGTVTSISGYSDLGGADSAVTLALWETALNQDMSKKATVIAGTLYHELGHTLGLSHGGLYYDTVGSYVPTFEANCKPNYQSDMNYLFQLDGVGPTGAIAYSNQTLTMLTKSSLGSVSQLVDTGVPGAAASFPTSSWYVSTAPSSGTSPATLHCDGTPLGGDVGYRINGSIAPITPAWVNGQNITFDGQAYSTLRGFNDVNNIDLRQLGATGGQFASLANVLSFGSSTTPLNIAPGGSVSVGPGGTVTLGAGGSISLAGGNVTIPSGGTISGGGLITFGTGGNVTLGAGGINTLAPGTNGIIGVLPGGGNVTLGAGGTVTLGAGGTVTLVGSSGNVTLGAGGTITLGGGGSVTIPTTGGSYNVPAGGTVTLGGGGTVTLGGGGTVTLGAGGTVTPSAGGTITLGGGGNVTLGAGGTVTLGAGGNVTLGGGGNVTLGAGGNVTLGAGGNVTLGGGGNVTLGAGGTVTLGGGGDISVGSGGNVTLGAGGTVTLGAGGNITLGGGGTVTLGGGGNVTLGAGGTVTLPSGGGSVVIPPGGSYTVPAGGTVTLGAGGNITLGGGGTVTLGGGGTVTLGAGGNVTLGAGGTVTLGAGGNITLGGGGNVTLGGGGATLTELDYGGANSTVRAPTLPTETSTIQGNVINWTAPAFGVVQTYTISRSVNGGAPVVIGSVSGVNGFAPATTFTDTNPPSGTLVYTITTTLVPDQGTNTQRQSPPSPPAVVTYNQTIVLGGLQSSYVLPHAPVPVTATITTSAPSSDPVPEVNFTASGSCSIVPGSQSITNGTSSANISLDSTGTCTITGAQSGATNFNPADPVSESFSILPQGSNLQSQTISFPQLPDMLYGNTFSLAATASSGLPVTFSTSGPCTINGKITGIGKCTVTASQLGNATYSQASTTQSFKIFPATLTVTAGNITVPFGQPIPSLANDYTITGFVNGDSASVLNGTAPALSTTATSSSAPGNYPIIVSTGSLAATNYTFEFVNGTLTMAALVPPSGTACNGTYSGTFKGNLTVSKGQNCVFFGGGTTGSITETGGNLVLTGSTIGTSVTINSGGTFTIGPSTTIKSSLTIENLPKSTTTSQVCGSTITGSLAVQSNGAPILIGSGTPSCAGNTIKGSLQVASNSAAVTMDGNSITGSLQVESNSGATTMNGNKVGVSLQDQSNTGATQVFNNIITNALQCQSNSSITGGGNTAASKSGQCAKF